MKTVLGGTLPRLLRTSRRRSSRTVPHQQTCNLFPKESFPILMFSCLFFQMNVIKSLIDLYNFHLY